jgi:alcohol dehydrogenase (cytochrome c)
MKINGTSSLVTLGLLACIAAAPAEWPVVAHGLDGNRYVQTSEITGANVTGLEKAWSYRFTDSGPFEDSPVVANGTMYIATPHNTIVALDPASGAVRWKHAINPHILQFATNRGVAVANGRVFIGTNDGHVVAVNAGDGRQLWSVLGVEDPTNSLFNAPAYAFDGNVLLGSTGGDYGNRGSVTAFNEQTGAVAWRWHTVPGPGEPGHDTWRGDSWKHGGADPWQGLAIDAATHIMYVAPGNPGPDLIENPRRGLDLYADSLVAVKIDDGRPRVLWFDKLVAHDTHDFDASMPPVLFDAPLKGVVRHLVATGDKTGNFWVFDRDTGRQLYRVALSQQVAIDQAPNAAGETTCPSHGGGIEYNGGAYDPVSHLFVVPSTDECASWNLDPLVAKTGVVPYVPGKFYLGGPLAKRGSTVGYLAGIDITTGKIAWRRKLAYPSVGGALLFASGVGFSSMLDGRFFAFDTRTGRDLWSTQLGAAVTAAPVAYVINGRTYVAIASGNAGLQTLPNVPNATGTTATLTVFALP